METEEIDKPVLFCSTEEIPSGIQRYALPKKGITILFETTAEGYRYAYNTILSNPHETTFWRLVVPYTVNHRDMVDYLLDQDASRKRTSTFTNKLEGDTIDAHLKLVKIAMPKDKEELMEEDVEKWPFPCKDRPIDYFCAGYLGEPELFYPKLLSGMNAIQEELALGNLKKREICAKYMIHRVYLDQQEHELGSLRENEKWLPNFLVNGPVGIRRNEMNEIMRNRLEGNRMDEYEARLDEVWVLGSMRFYHKGRIVEVGSGSEYFKEWYDAMLGEVASQFSCLLAKEEVIEQIKSEETFDDPVTGKEKRVYLDEPPSAKRARLEKNITNKDHVNAIMNMKFSELESLQDITNSEHSVRKFWKQKIT